MPDPGWQRNSHRSGGTAHVGYAVAPCGRSLRRPDAKWRPKIVFVRGVLDGWKAIVIQSARNMRRGLPP
jgi:hypothetical protein